MLQIVRIVHVIYLIRVILRSSLHFIYLVIIYVFVQLLCRNEDLHRILTQLTSSNVLGKLAIRDLNNWVIQELLLADLAKTQYTRDDKGPYSRIDLDQHR